MKWSARRGVVQSRYAQLGEVYYPGTGGQEGGDGMEGKQGGSGGAGMGSVEQVVADMKYSKAQC